MASTSGPAAPGAPPGGSRLVATVAERARSTWGLVGQQTIGIGLLGVSSFNRGRLGVSPFHIHDVAASIAKDGLSRHRYHCATAVEVPDQELAEFRKFNADMCSTDDKLPPFSPSMRYACLSKNHFVTALKLFKAGNIVDVGSGEVIRPNSADSNLTEHLSDGVTCEVMKEGLWSGDLEGMLAIIAEDNLNAAVSMAVGEMEVLTWFARSIADRQKAGP